MKCKDENISAGLIPRKVYVVRTMGGSTIGVFPKEWAHCNYIIIPNDSNPNEFLIRRVSIDA